MSNNFLGSNIQNSVLATETTLKQVESLLSGTINVSTTPSGTQDVDIKDINFATTQTDNLKVEEQDANFVTAMDNLANNQVDVSLDTSNITGDILVVNNNSSNNPVFVDDKKIIYKEIFDSNLSAPEWTTVNSLYSNLNGLRCTGSNLSQIFTYDISSEYVMLEANIRFVNNVRGLFCLRLKGVSTDLLIHLDKQDAGGNNYLQCQLNDSVGTQIPVQEVDNINWDIDKADGSGNLPLIDFNTYNTYRIIFYCFGMAEFQILNPLTHQFQPVHRLNINNAETVFQWNRHEVQIEMGRSAGNDQYVGYVSLYSQSKLNENINTLKGIPVSTNSGNKDDGTQRVVVANDDTNLSILPKVKANNRLRINNPNLLFNGNFAFDKQPNMWDYTLVSGSGITENFVQKLIRISTTGSNAGVFNMSCKQLFNCNSVNNVYYCSISPKNIGLTELCRIQIGLFRNTGSQFSFFFNGDNTHKIELERETQKTTIPEGSFNVNTTVLGDRNGSITIFFEFNQAGLTIGQIYQNEYRVFHRIDANDEGDFITFHTLKPFIQVEQDALESTPYDIDVISCTLISENINRHMKFPRSYYKTSSVSYSSGSNYAVLGLRYDPLLTDSHLQLVNLVSYDLTPTSSAGTYSLTVIKNPTINNSPVWTSQTDSCIQIMDGDSSNTFSGGTPLFSIVIDDDTGRIYEKLPDKIPLFENDELVLCIDVITGFSGIASINWEE